MRIARAGFVVAAVIASVQSLACARQQIALESTTEAAQQQEVRAVLDSWLAALIRGDVTSLEKIIAPDYAITVADGRVLNREQDLAPIRLAQFKFLSAEVEDVRIRIVGTAAIVTGIGKYTILANGKNSTFRERFTDVYAKRDGQWHPIASHSTPLRGT
jgi:uncharacterized protein (TIGR02246 family)